MLDVFILTLFFVDKTIRRARPSRYTSPSVSFIAEFPRGPSKHYTSTDAFTRPGVAPRIQTASEMNSPIICVPAFYSSGERDTRESCTRDVMVSCFLGGAQRRPRDENHNGPHAGARPPKNNESRLRV